MAFESPDTDVSTSSTDTALLTAERQSLVPYVTWLQAIDLGPGLRLLRSDRGRRTKQEPCSILTEHGRRYEEHAKKSMLFAKVRIIKPERISFELVNCYTGLRYFGEADMDEATFPFSNRDITTSFDGVPNSWCDVEDFGKNCVLSLGGADYKFEESSSITTDEEDHDEESTINDPEETPQEITPVPAELRKDDGPAPDSPNHRVGDQIHAPIPQNQNDMSKPSENRFEDTIQYKVLQSKLKSLQTEVISLNAQLIVEKVENSIAQDTLNKMSSMKPTRFNIQEYRLRKLISSSYNGRLYGVEHSSGKCHVLKEIINFEGDFINESKNVTIANELALLNFMRSNIPDNLLHIEDVQIEHTPLRKSHYFLSEPAAFSLEEFANTNLRNCDQAVPYIIGAQILSGLIFLKESMNRVHGNLSCNSVLIDFSGTVKLSCFEFAFPIGTVLQPNFLLSDASSVAYKHTQILESRDRAQPVAALPVMDIWSVGCIMFRLLNGGDLFVGPPTIGMRSDTTGRAYEDPVRECVGDLLTGYYDTVQPESVLRKNVFLGLEKEKVPNHYKIPQ